MAKQRTNKGFILLHREIMDWQHWNDANILKVWLTLLFSANYEKGWRRGVKCRRGETVITLEELRDRTGISRPTLVKILCTLENSGEIKRVKIDQKHTKTIIKKYSDYQDVNLISGKVDLPQPLPQTLPQPLLNKYTKKYNNNIIIEDDKSATARTYEEFLQDLLSRESLIAQYCQNERITVQDFKRLAAECVIEWELTNKTHTNESDRIRHLLDHIRVKARAKREDGTLVGDGDKTERLAPLIDDCKQLIEEGHDRKDVAEFYAYWTQQANDQSGRMLFEAARGWDTETRFKMRMRK